MSNPVQICVFNATSKLIDITTAAETGPGIEGTPVVLNSQGVVDPSLLGNGVTAIAGESFAAGSLVNLYSNAGVLTAQLAYASNVGTAPSGAAYPVLAAGFVSGVTAATTVATVSFVGLFTYVDTHTEFSASDIGTEVYLSAIDKGGITKTRPVAPLAGQSVGYVLAYSSATHTVTSLFLAGFNDFSHISGIATVSQGGTGSATTGGAIHNIFGQPAAKTFFAGVASGGVADATFRTIVNTDLSGAIFTSGGSHNPGAVPDPGATLGGGTVTGPGRFLREDAQWAVPNAASDHPGLTTSIGPTTLLTPTVTGMFRVSVYEVCTIAGASGATQAFGNGTFGSASFNGGGSPFGLGVFGSGIFNMVDDNVQTSISWTDDSGVRSATPVSLPLDLGALNAASGQVFIRALVGQPITFTSALAATGTPTYGVFLRLETM